MERPACKLCGGRHYSYEGHLEGPVPKPRRAKATAGHQGAPPKPERAPTPERAGQGPRDAEPFLNLKQAREFLGVSRTKLWDLVKEGRLSLYRAPLDKRVRLVRREDLEALKVPQRGPGVQP